MASTGSSIIYFSFLVSISLNVHFARSALNLNVDTNLNARIIATTAAGVNPQWIGRSNVEDDKFYILQNYPTPFTFDRISLENPGPSAFFSPSPTFTTGLLSGDSLDCDVFDVSPSDIVACSFYTNSPGGAKISIIDNLDSTPSITGTFIVPNSTWSQHNYRGVYPSFVNDTLLLVYQETNMRLLDITNRANIVQVAQWKFTAYPSLTSHIYIAKAITPERALVVIGSLSSPAKALLIDLTNTSALSIVKSFTLASASQNPSFDSTLWVKGTSVVTTDSYAFWATRTNLYRLDFFNWNVTSTNWPQPYSNGIAGNSIFCLTMFQNTSQLILTATSVYDTIFMDVSNFTNVQLVDAIAGSGTALMGFTLTTPNRNFLISTNAFLVNNVKRPNTLQSYTYLNSTYRVDSFISHPCLPDNIVFGRNNFATPALFLMDVANPTNVFISTIPNYVPIGNVPGGCAKFDIASNGIAFCTDRYALSVYLYNMTNVNFPVAIGVFNVLSFPSVTNWTLISGENIADAFISSDGKYVFVFPNLGKTIAMFDISNPTSVSLVTVIPYPGGVAGYRVRQMRSKPYFFATGSGSDGNYMWTYNSTTISQVASYNSFTSSYLFDLQFSANDTILYMLDINVICSLNVSNPAIPTNFQMSFLPFYYIQLFNPEEFVIARDESLMLVLGSSTMVAVFNISTSVPNFIGWIYGFARITSAMVFMNNGNVEVLFGSSVYNAEVHKIGNYSGGFLPIRETNFCSVSPVPAPTPPTPKPTPMPTPKPTPVPTPPTPQPTPVPSPIPSPIPTPVPTPPTPQPSPVPTPPTPLPPATNTETTPTISFTSTEISSTNSDGSQTSSSGSNSTALIGIVVGVVAAALCLILIVLIVGYVLYRRSSNNRSPKAIETELKTAMENDKNDVKTPYTNVPIPQTGHDYQSVTISESGSRNNSNNSGGKQLLGMRTIAESNLEISKKQLGKGAFGVVYAGTYKGKPVAVKEFESDMKFSNVHDEAMMMSQLTEHPNVVNLVGVIEGPPLKIVTELMPGGNLLNYLKEHNLEINMERRMKWIVDVAVGMEFLIKNGVIHRDLAARNVLLDDKLNAKVSDFGLSKVVESKKDAIYSTSGVGPLRWMSPEALEKKKYSEKSDVWSFGVCTFEILTAQTPYEDLDDPVVVAGKVMNFLLKPSFPTQTPDVLKNMESILFANDPEDRPTFKAIVLLLGKK